MKKINVLISMNISKNNTYYIEEVGEEINSKDLENEVYEDILNSPIELTLNMDNSDKWIIDSIEIIEEPL